MKSTPRQLFMAGALALAACAPGEAPEATTAPVPSSLLAVVDTATIMDHIRVLAADSLMGRLPGSEGEEKTVAYLEGSDPLLKDEYVIYTAHWDHFGIGTPVDGDSIHNGAADNASGTAGLLTVAKAFAELKTPPKRSVLFLAVTAEEQGLLGSLYYTVSPVYPLAKTVATINMDVLNTWGRAKDLVVIGLGASDLDN